MSTEFTDIYVWINELLLSDIKYRGSKRWKPIDHGSVISRAMLRETWLNYKIGDNEYRVY